MLALALVLPAHPADDAAMWAPLSPLGADPTQLLRSLASCVRVQVTLTLTLALALTLSMGLRCWCTRASAGANRQP